MYLHLENSGQKVLYRRLTLLKCFLIYVHIKNTAEGKAITGPFSGYLWPGCAVSSFPSLFLSPRTVLQTQFSEQAVLAKTTCGAACFVWARPLCWAWGSFWRANADPECRVCLFCSIRRRGPTKDGAEMWDRAGRESSWPAPLWR